MGGSSTGLAAALPLRTSIARDRAASLALDKLTISVRQPLGSRTRYILGHLASGSTVTNSRPDLSRRARH